MAICCYFGKSVTPADLQRLALNINTGEFGFAASAEVEPNGDILRIDGKESAWEGQDIVPDDELAVIANAHRRVAGLPEFVQVAPLET